jgi:hypothetical protein
VAIGRDRLDRLADAAGAAVGLENLALAMSREDALAQGDLLEALLRPQEGFLVLDLHNLFCQAASFDLDGDVLLARMPLDRVREIHVSGGSWWTGAIDPSRPFRRDTHDGPCRRRSSPSSNTRSRGVLAPRRWCSSGWAGRSASLRRSIATARTSTACEGCSTA